MPAKVSIVVVLGHGDGCICHAHDDRGVGWCHRAGLDDERAARGMRTVECRVVPFRIGQDLGEQASGVHDGGLARGKIFDANLPCQVIELRLEFQGFRDSGQLVSGRHDSFLCFASVE